MSVINGLSEHHLCFLALPKHQMHLKTLRLCLPVHPLVVPPGYAAHKTKQPHTHSNSKRHNNTNTNTHQTTTWEVRSPKPPENKSVCCELLCCVEHRETSYTEDLPSTRTTSGSRSEQPPWCDVGLR